MNEKVVTKYYSDNPEWYHTKRHVENLYFLYDVYKDRFKREFPDLNEEKLFLCFDFHDAIYVPGNDTNEEESVQAYLNEGGRDQEVIDAILSTKIGVVEFKNSLQKVLHDLDWSGFRDYVTMSNNEKKIIMEAVEKGHFSEFEARFHYEEFLRKIFQKNIYVTNVFGKFNDNVSINIERRLQG